MVERSGPADNTPGPVDHHRSLAGMAGGLFEEEISAANNTSEPLFPHPPWPPPFRESKPGGTGASSALFDVYRGGSHRNKNKIAMVAMILTTVSRPVAPVSSSVPPLSCFAAAAAPGRPKGLPFQMAGRATFCPGGSPRVTPRGSDRRGLHPRPPQPHARSGVRQNPRHGVPTRSRRPGTVAGECPAGTGVHPVFFQFAGGLRRRSPGSRGLVPR